MVTIVNYGLGNLGSILSMLRKLGASALVTSDPNEIARASKLILPGVGSFDTAMTNLREMNLIAALEQKVIHERAPILGICLGMQLFARGSEEGVLPGLGWINARFSKFRPSAPNLRVPHMGWNWVRVKRDSAIFSQAMADQRFYFVHSYKAMCEEAKDVLCTTDYDGEFVSGYGRDNIVGVQFHPEKSHRFGLELFERFLKM